jgi:hypothetical protein
VRWSWLRAFTVSAAVTLAATTSACIRIGYERVRDPDDAMRPEPAEDSSSGGRLDADAPQPSEEAGTTRLEDAGPTLPEDAGATLPEDAGTARLEDAGATLPEDAATTQPYERALTRECGTGVQLPELADACWYLGALGLSCAQVCASHGGYIAEVSYVGTAAEGGTLARCDMLLDLLVGPGETTSGVRADNRALDCHLYAGARWWLASGPAFDPLVSASNAQLVCSCNGP